jgi:hypothetical protein
MSIRAVAASALCNLKLLVLPTPAAAGSCSTCVGEAVATAVQMAIANALNDNAADWDIDARSLYYCSLKGRTCKVGCSSCQTHPNLHVTELDASALRV